MSDSVWPHRWQPTRLPRPGDSPGKNPGVGCHFLLQCMKVKSESEVAQSCPTVRNPMDCSLPGSPVHGIFQARVLEWGAITFSMYSWQRVNLFLCYFELKYIGNLGMLCIAIWHLLCWVLKIFLSANLLVKKIQITSQWHPTPVLLPRKSHGQKSLVGCSPWGR